MADVPEERLTEEHPDPEQERVEEEREAEERREELSDTVLKAAERITGDARTITVNIMVGTAATPNAERALSVEPVKDPKVTTVDASVGAGEKKASDDEVKKVADEAAGSDPKEAAKKKEGSLRKYVFAFTLFSLIGPQLKAVFEGLTRAVAGEKMDELITDAGQRAALAVIATEWRNEDDATYWADFAGLVERLSLTAADCVYFLQFTMLLYPVEAGDDFEWSTSKDLTDKVDELMTIYSEDTAKGKSAVIKALPDLKYAGLPLPRLVAADLGQRAMAKIALEAAKKKPSGGDTTGNGDTSDTSTTGSKP